MALLTRFVSVSAAAQGHPRGPGPHQVPRVRRTARLLPEPQPEVGGVRRGGDSEQPRPHPVRPSSI
eukprot:2435976-Pyramimonas_sp.AAC.1